MEITDGDSREPSYDLQISAMSVERTICGTSWAVGEVLILDLQSIHMPHFVREISEIRRGFASDGYVAIPL